MEYNQDMKNRLKRIEGQVRGVLRMMEEGKDCREVITQLTHLVLHLIVQLDLLLERI